jgi:hypothetical protein
MLAGSISGFDPQQTLSGNRDGNISSYRVLLCDSRSIIGARVGLSRRGWS